MNTQICLRDFQDSDMQLLHDWLYTGHVAKWYCNPENWLYEAAHRGDEFSWIHHFIAMHNGIPVGFCQYYPYAMSAEDWHGDTDTTGVYSMDYLIGRKDYLGIGCGKQLLLALLGRISACADARAVIVQPDAANKASCGVLLSVGFSFDEKNRLFRLDLRGASGNGK